MHIPQMVETVLKVLFKMFHSLCNEVLFRVSWQNDDVSGSNSVNLLGVLFHTAGSNMAKRNGPNATAREVK